MTVTTEHMMCIMSSAAVWHGSVRLITTRSHSTDSLLYNRKHYSLSMFSLHF